MKVRVRVEGGNWTWRWRPARSRGWDEPDLEGGGWELELEKQVLAMP